MRMYSYLTRTHMRRKLLGIVFLLPTTVVAQMSPTLRLDLCSLIIRHVTSISDLLSISLCCSSFRLDAQSGLLFRPQVVKPSQQSRLISCIASYPTRLGPMVRILSLRYDIKSNRSEEITAAFKAMCNLNQLSLSDKGTYALRRMHGHTFQLDAFEFISPPLNECLALHRFLSTQPQLKHLAIHSLYTGSNPMSEELIAARLCPQLESLTGDEPLIKAFFRDGRPITQFTWVGFSDPSFSPAQLGQLEFLSFPMSEHRGITFAANLTSLEVLELRGLPLWT